MSDHLVPVAEVPTPATLFERALRHHGEGRVVEAGALYAQLLRQDPGHAGAWCNVGVIAQTAGRFDEAVAAFRAAVAVQIDDWNALANLSVALRGRRRFGEAIACLGWAVVLRPGDAAVRLRLAMALRAIGDNARAHRAFRAYLCLEPADAAVWSDTANVRLALGEHAIAMAAVRRAVRLRPDWVAIRQNHGAAARTCSLADEAFAAYGQAVRLDPRLVDGWVSLGELLRDANAPDMAERHLRVAAMLDPARADLYATMADLDGRRGRLAAAEAVARRALRIDADNARARNNLGVALLSRERFDEAAEHLHKACVLAPLRGEMLTNLGAALKGLGLLDRALAVLRASVALDPPLPQTYNNLGNVEREYCLVEGAVNSYRRATVLKPDYAMAYRNLLPTVLYSPRWGREARFGLHRLFEERLARPLYGTRAPPANVRDPERRLRVGYLSSDFRSHVVARNVLPLFENRDRARFEVVCYADVAVPDTITARFRASADGWRDILGVDDRGAAEMIRADGIDILVCLAGHFDRNRPLVCAYRPAPVQVSFHDPVTSGLSVMDYLIADPVLVPRSGTEIFTERVVRLPSYYLAVPLSGAPDPTPPPCLTTGQVTFGCFNVPSKLAFPVLELWAEVMHQVPGSRLALKYRNLYGVPGLRRRMVDAFAGLGIAADRLDFRASVDSSPDHMDGYRSIDIALDPFPFCGSTTTYEALWMGVPVVTLPAAFMVGRWSASMLKAVGLEEMIATDPADYVAICRALAAEPQRLAELRSGLRGRVAASSLCDGARKARQLERLYRAMWRRWCAPVD